MTLYSIHIICKVCGAVIFMSEPLPHEDVESYKRSLVTSDEIIVIDIFYEKS